MIARKPIVSLTDLSLFAPASTRGSRLPDNKHLKLFIESERIMSKRPPRRGETFHRINSCDSATEKELTDQLHFLR